MTPIRILLADDHPIIREGLRAYLSSQKSLAIVGEASNGMEVLEKAVALAPDVVLMDIAMEQMDGFAATSALTAVHPGARVVIVTNHDNPDFREAATAAGACGYVLKQNLLELPEVLARIREPGTRN